jgi:hypothetical protein
MPNLYTSRSKLVVNNMRHKTKKTLTYFDVTDNYVNLQNDRKKISLRNVMFIYLLRDSVLYTYQIT